MKTWRCILCFACALTLANAASAANDLAAILGARGFASGNFSITETATGTPDKLTLKATVQVAPEDTGKQGEVYAIATLPGMAFFKDAKGIWSLWTGGSFPAYFQGPLGTHAVDIVSALNSTQLPGIAFYVGYGLDQADMLANGKYSRISTKPQAPPVALDGVWEVVSGSGIFHGQGSYVVFDPSGMLVSVDRDGCTSVSSYVASGNTIMITVLFNQYDASCGAEVPVGTVIQAGFTLDQNGLTVLASDGSSATLRKFTVPYYTATGSYSPAAGSIVWATSDFPCSGPVAGETSIVSVGAITETSMTWSYKDKTVNWVRDAGAAGDIAGTWRMADPGSGNLYELTIGANGAVTFVGYVAECVDKVTPATEEYSVWTGMTRRMGADGETSDMVLHVHGWAPQGMIGQIALSGPSLSATFSSLGTMVRDGVTVDEFTTDTAIAVAPRAGDVYTFTVQRKDGGTFTRTQTLSKIVLDAPRITSPAGHGLADASLGQPLSLTWTLPAGISAPGVNIMGQVCGKAGCMSVEGVAAGDGAGSITLPFVDGAVSASIDLRIHYAGEVFMNCWYEFR
ncbi:MAG: hypothetical protein HY850_11115 [Betaproteobacteria bacterium]|nr:hypothetical protein [Betaproteobacteria bacterium]